MQKKIFVEYRITTFKSTVTNQFCTGKHIHDHYYSGDFLDYSFWLADVTYIYLAYKCIYTSCLKRIKCRTLMKKELVPQTFEEKKLAESRREELTEESGRHHTKEQ